MAKTVLFLRPWNDPLTSYLHTWTEILIEDAEKNVDNILNIEGEKAIRKNFTSYVKRHKPSFIQLNGHGNAGLLVGHDGKPILDLNNAELTKGAIVYSRSCSTAQVLGKICVSKGTKCYIGYKNNFYMPRDKSKMQKPLEDVVASCTLEPSNQLIRSILKGHTVKDSRLRALSVAKEKLNLLLSSQAPSGSYLTRFALISNIRNQVVLGDENAKLE